MQDAQAYLDCVQKYRWNTIKVNMTINLLGTQVTRKFQPAERIWTYKGQRCMGLAS